MTMISLSDAIGLLASISLVVAPARDQIARWKARPPGASRWRAARMVLSEEWEGHRNRFSGLESLTTAVGGAGLAVSFFLKLFGL